MQTKKGSLFEISCNMASGFIVSWMLTLWFFPTFFNLNLTVTHAWSITFVYTVVSVIRSYCWRRVFNWFIVRKELSDAS